MTPPILDVAQVSRHYGAHQAVATASFQLDPGRIACLLGPSGCGKSTLLRMIAGLEPVDAGQIRINGAIASKPGYAIAPEHRGVGLVFRDFALFPHLNVSDNVAFGLRGRAPVAKTERVAEMLARFRIEHLADAWPHTLSGGEQQRVAIARALAREPELILLDEPFSGLDGHLRADVRDALIADLRATQTSVLIVTHDPDEAMQIADHLILMARGQVLQTGTPPHCYRDPVSVQAARLLGEAIVFAGHIDAGVAHSPIGPVAAPGQPDGPVELMVRPEALRLCHETEAGTAGVHAQVLRTRFAGATHAVEVRIGDTRFWAPVQRDAPPPADAVRLLIDPDEIRLYR